MKEMIEAFRADVERTEAARLRFITMRTVEARNLLDMLEQTSRAQRTSESEVNSAAAPAAGQAGLAKLFRYDSFETDEGDEMRVEPEGRWVRFDAVEKLFATLAAPVAAQSDIPADAPAAFAKRYTALIAENVRLEKRIAEVESAAPVAADTEQATIDTPPFRELLDEFAYWASERRAMGGDYGSADNEEVAEAALIEYIDSVKLAPLATPADAGAGAATKAQLTDDEITEVVRRAIAAGGIIWSGFKKDDDGKYLVPDLTPKEFKLARAIEAEVLARLSTPAAQVTASDAGGKANAECLLEEVAQLRQVIAGFAGGARQAASGDEVEMFLRWCDQVKLPIDAPDGSFSMRAFRWAKVAWLYRAALDNHSEELLDMAGQSPAPVTAVPADRDAILEDAALQCEAEKVHVQKWHPSSDGDEAYNAGCDDCAKAIRALKSMERAADATDEQPTDKALLDDLDAWVRQNKEAGCEWFNFAFDTKSTARQQLAADMALRAADAAETRDAKGGEHE